jgi:hypothetical protein
MRRGRGWIGLVSVAVLAVAGCGEGRKSPAAGGRLLSSSAVSPGDPEQCTSGAAVVAAGNAVGDAGWGTSTTRKKPHPKRAALIAQARTGDFNDQEIDQGVVLVRLTRMDGAADQEFGVPPNGATYLWVGKCGGVRTFTLASTDGKYYLHNVVAQHDYPPTPNSDRVQWTPVQGQGIFGGAPSSALSDTSAATVDSLVNAGLATYTICTQCGAKWCHS